jgi:hypothetical protein
MTKGSKSVRANDGAEQAPGQSSGKTYREVSQLAAELQELIKRMLIEGATIEDAVEAVNERGGESITLQAVQSFFRSNRGLQKQRVEWQLGNAQVLKEALVDAGSTMEEYAECVLMTGLERLRRAEAIITTNDTLKRRFEQENLKLKERLENENLQLKKQHQRLKNKQAKAQDDYYLQRVRTETMRHKKVKLELDKIKDGLRAASRGAKLDAQTVKKIQEIYGIVSEPIIPPYVEGPEKQ